MAAQPAILSEKIKGIVQTPDNRLLLRAASRLGRSPFEIDLF